MEDISWQDIRKVIIDFLNQRLSNNSNYKSELAKLDTAKQANDLVTMNESQQKINELVKRFDFETWMEDAATRRIKFLILASHLSKGIHPSSKASNANYITQMKPDSCDNFVSSATVIDLPFDATGGASSLDIFGLLKQKVKDDITILKLIVNDHPKVKNALSDDENKAAIYLENLKKLLSDNWIDSQASELNKQFFWPNNEEIYLSPVDNNYRLLIPLHPSSLCNIVYQKVQTRFSDENKKAREQRFKKGFEQQHYFSFHDLAIVKLGGSNAQNASQLIGSQMGRNFLLPSMPPKFSRTVFPTIANSQETIFNKSLQYYCRSGFRLLFDTINAKKNVFKERNNRKEAFYIIISLILKFVNHLQSSKHAGWTRDSSLNISQQLWLDPKRINLKDEIKFKQHYELGIWQQELEQQFADWVQKILRNKFDNIKEQFSDPEFKEWCREFRPAIKAHQHKYGRIG